MSRTRTLTQTTRTPDERRRHIESTPLPANIGALIDEACADAGDRMLWNFFESGETVTYDDMRARVHRLAAGLQSVGITKGAHVAVMLPNVAAFPLTWLALGLVGAVMVPVNVGYQARELAYVLDDSDAAFLVVDAACMAVVDTVLAAGSSRVDAQRLVVLGGSADRGHAWEHLARCASTPVLPDVTHDDLLNIQYTSGTTGFPKGCMLTQRYWIVAGKVNAARDDRSYRRILASTPFYYMDPQWLLLMTLYQRATLYVAGKQSTSRFTGWLRRFDIEFCLFPYVVFKQPETAHDTVPSVIRGNIYGAPKAIHGAIEDRFDFCAREAFGMTEVGSAMYMPIEAVDMVGSGSCGIPSPFRECRIVDAEGREVPRGEVGELVIRGAGILQGYYRKPEATARALRDGWFHTGDLFRQDERGYFTIVGRVKDMIRRSAENIAAREVESVINSVSSVLESAVIGVPDDLRGEEVKAYLVTRDGVVASDELLDDIIATCGAQLAKFKVPRYYTFRAALPKTPSLKIAKDALKTEAARADERTYDRVERRWSGVAQKEMS